MLPHTVILAVFTALVSQGNVVSALPQGSFEYMNSDRIGGNERRDLLNAESQFETRAIEVEDSALVAREAEPEPYEDNDAALEVRADPLPPATVFFVVASSVGLIATGNQFVRWIAKTEKGAKAVKATKDAAKKFYDAMRKKDKRIAKASDADIEMALAPGGFVGVAPERRHSVS